LVTSLHRVWLVRHGATQWSLDGRHTSVTDIPVTLQGEAQAAAVGRRLAGFGVAVRLTSVWTSPRRRAERTCELALAAAGLDPVPVVRPDLAEWDYGAYEGLTSAEIAERDPEWSVWTAGGPGGETPGSVSDRADGVVTDLLGCDGEVALFSHGHFLRALAARWLGLDVAWGRTLPLEAGSLSALGFDHQDRAIHLWNEAP
jgi:broad specificity phosphatase PhoE